MSVCNNVPQNVVNERSQYDFATEAEYYFYRGKIAAIQGIWKFISEGGGTSRHLAYDCLDIDYVSALDAGAMNISNFIFELYEGPKPK